MARHISTIEEAKEAAEALKKLYGFNTKKKPAWFQGISIGMQQDGSYDVSICIPAWGSITQDEQNDLPDNIKGVKIGLRVVTPSPFQLRREEEKKKAEEKKPEEKKPEEKKEEPKLDVQPEKK